VCIEGLVFKDRIFYERGKEIKQGEDLEKIKLMEFGY
jgi:hypothetical protein